MLCHPERAAQFAHCSCQPCAAPDHLQLECVLDNACDDVLWEHVVPCAIAHGQDWVCECAKAVQYLLAPGHQPFKLHSSRSQQPEGGLVTIAVLAWDDASNQHCCNVDCEQNRPLPQR